MQYFSSIFALDLSISMCGMQCIMFVGMYFVDFTDMVATLRGNFF